MTRLIRAVALDMRMMIAVERHDDGYVAYTLGFKGVVVGEGDTHEEAVADVKSAIEFHVKTIGAEVLRDSWQRVKRSHPK